MGNILSKIAEENGWDGDRRPLARSSQSDAPCLSFDQATLTAAELDAIRKEISELRNDAEMLRNRIDRHTGRIA